MTKKYLKLPELSFQDVERFWKKVKIQPNGCWEWQATKTRAGYGNFFLMDGKKERNTMSHRVAYKIYYLKDPEGFCVCHTCDNPKCVNPLHLWLGTMADNNRDKMLKGHYYKGQEHWAKKNPEKIPRGETHWSQTQPHTVAGLPRGESHWSKRTPELCLRGERHGMAKLTEILVKEIREKYAKGNETFRGLARIYGVNRVVIRRIILRQLWKHI